MPGGYSMTSRAPSTSLTQLSLRHRRWTASHFMRPSLSTMHVESTTVHVFDLDGSRPLYPRGRTVCFPLIRRQSTGMSTLFQFGRTEVSAVQNALRSKAKTMIVSIVNYLGNVRAKICRGPDFSDDPKTPPTPSGPSAFPSDLIGAL